MTTPKTELQKLATLNTLSRDAERRFEGYRFQKDSLANQMAFVFGGKEGEEEAARILRVSV